MYDVAAGHLGGIMAPLILVPMAWLVLRRLPGYRSAEAVTRATSVLLLITGFVHLGLVPAHLIDTPLTAVLFLIDGLGFIALAIAAFTVRWWRGAAAWWLGATIVAYLVWVIAGWETPDQVGIACKLLELVALGLVMRLRTDARTSWPRRAWRASRLPLITVITTVAIFIGGLAHPDALHAHAGAVLQPANPYATAAQQAAAARLLHEVRVALTAYRDPQAAMDAGFKPGPKGADPLLHWENKANAGVILDPARPQDLVYLRTPQGLMLLGAMYQMPKIGQWGPDPGGPLTQWHQHEGICFSPFGFEISFATPFWGCPVGAINVTAPPMLHVWVVDNPNGAFSADFDPARQRALAGR